MTSPQVTMQWQKLWRLALAALLSIGIISCCIYLPADSWENKGPSYINTPIVRTINSASRPLLITDLWVYNVNKIGNLLGMSNQIDPEANFLLMSPKNVEIPEKFTEIFLYSISKKLKTQIAKMNQYKIQTIYAQNHEMVLGKIVKK